MCTKKEVVIFLAGAEAFHSFAHVVMYGYNITFQLPWIHVTQNFQLAAFLINLAITVALLYWASKIRK